MVISAGQWEGPDHRPSLPAKLCVVGPSARPRLVGSSFTCTGSSCCRPGVRRRDRGGEASTPVLSRCRGTGPGGGPAAAAVTGAPSVCSGHLRGRTLRKEIATHGSPSLLLLFSTHPGSPCGSHQPPRRAHSHQGQDLKPKRAGRAVHGAQVKGSIPGRRELSPANTPKMAILRRSQPSRGSPSHCGCLHRPWGAARAWGSSQGPAVMGTVSAVYVGAHILEF